MSQLHLLDDPLHQNLLAAVATVAYVKAVVGLCDFGVSHQFLAPRISRKCVHMAAGAWILWWPLFRDDHWTWRLNVTVPAVYTVQLFVKGFFLKDPNDTDVQTMTRTGDPKELLNGPILFTVLMTLVGLTLFRQRMGVIIMSCLGFGDGVAPLMGYYFPFGFYPTWPFGPNDRKTLSGSVGFVVASVLGYQWMSLMILGGDETGSSEDIGTMLQVATVAAITEGISGAFDNPCVAASAALTYRYLTKQ